jgi:endo-1,4-beta-xylanase
MDVGVRNDTLLMRAVDIRQQMKKNINSLEDCMNTFLTLFRHKPIFIALLIGISATGNAQLVTNGGFEDSNTGDITSTSTKGWFIGIASGINPPPVFEIVNDTVQQGTRALKVTVHGLGTNNWDVQIVADSIPVRQGATYNYTVMGRSRKRGATVNFTVGGYSTAEIKAIRPATLSTAWWKFSMQFTVTDSIKFIRAPIHFYGTVDTGNAIWIDNLQITELNVDKKPVIVEAESGNSGSNFPILQDSTITYVDVNSNSANTGNPGDTSRVITYQIQFADSGMYNLFARVRVDSSSGSFFYGNGFGSKDETLSSDWVTVDGLTTAGFSSVDDVVDSPGSVGNGIWKWVNLTKNAYQGTQGNPFAVSLDSLTKIFQIGGGNHGLDIDKIAFCKSTLYYTVGSLDNRQLGIADTTTIYKGPALAAGQNKFLGCADDNPNNNFTKYWTQLTPGNAGKWGSVAGASTDTAQWNWSGLDAVYDYAMNNQLAYKHHTLIWGAQQPSWISSLDSAQKVYYIETWIRMVGQRYSNIDMVDVVNEALDGHNPPDGGGSPARANYENALGGSGTTGWDWVIWAFTKARQYIPNAKLLLNDYGIINDSTATTQYLVIINLLKDRGLIDGIGVQGHRFELESADTNTIKNNLDRLAATGLPIYISEFDLGNLNDAGTPNDNQQLQLYQKIFPILWQHSGVKGITLWGYIENQMWQPTCYVLRLDGTARPALLWLALYIKNNPSDIEKTATRIPSNFELEQNFPNPFNPATTIRYNISRTSNVTLKIFDILGRQVQILVNTKQSPGQYMVTFNAQRLSSGIYFYQLTAGNFTETKKLMLLK